MRSAQSVVQAVSGTNPHPRYGYHRSTACFTQLSNLNRQFLFKAEHKGMSISLVAKESVLKLNPHLNIEAHHCNIKDLPLSFFNQFQYLVMALDNVEARYFCFNSGTTSTKLE